jgi:arginase family enzyme
LGKFVVDSWLTPKPQVSDLDLIREECYEHFLINDGFRAYAQLLRGFVKAHVFPHIPGMIGVDHSLTGGVLMALSDRFGPEDLGVLVFDVHTDAAPLPIRSGLAQYASEEGLSEIDTISKPAIFDPYTRGNFLFYLIEEGIILPENLILIGPGDTVDKLSTLTDKRVVEYVHHYESLMERGVKIISRDQLQQSGPAAIQKEQDRLNCSKLYISLDVDVSAQCGVLATKFIDLVGTDIALILEVASNIVEIISSRRFSIVGLDIMEIDIQKIGARLSSGIEDRTRDFIREFIRLIVQGVY